MPTATDTTPAEELLALVADTDLLTDDEKDLYIAEILEGRIHPDLEARLNEICDREIAVTTADIESLNEEIAAQDALIAQAQEEDNIESTRLVAEFEQGVVATVAEHKHKCEVIERDLDRDVQGIVETQKEKPEVDAIRAMLAQKPDAPQA